MQARTLSRPESFHKIISETIHAVEPDELADRITEVHTSVVNVLEGKLTALARESTQVHEDVRRRNYMLAQVENVAAREIRSSAEQAATIAHQGQVLGKVLTLVGRAGASGQVAAADLAALLEEQIPLVTYTPQVIAFIADDKFRSGQFRSRDGRVTMNYTFVGWSLVTRGAGRGLQIQPTFLVGDRGALPQSVIELDKGLELQQPLAPALQLI